MKFSVIIPVYNKADTLMQSVESVLRQFYDDFEIVIVDDGSTDGFCAIAEQLSANPKVRIIRQENAGVSVARNTGIKQAKGTFICFLDADDLYEANHLQELNRLIEKYPEQSYFATSHITSYPDGRCSGSSKWLTGFLEDFVCENLFLLLNKYADGIIHTNSMCIKKSVMLENNLFFEPGEKIGEDTDMWFRTALLQPIILSKKETTVYRREFSTATAATTNSMAWIFPRRMETIQKMDIPAPIKTECEKLVDRYKMTCSRDCLCRSDKKTAYRILKTVEHKTVKYYISVILCAVPLKLSQWLIAHL